LFATELGANPVLPQSLSFAYFFLARQEK